MIVKTHVPYALIVSDCHQRDQCDLNLLSYSDSLAAVMNILDLFISLHLTCVMMMLHEMLTTANANVEAGGQLFLVHS